MRADRHIGANPRGGCGFRRELAQKPAMPHTSLAVRAHLINVGHVDSVRPEARPTTHIFSTPSLVGQFCAKRADLPDNFVFAGKILPVSKLKPAEIARSHASILRVMVNPSWVAPSSNKRRKDTKSCALDHYCIELFSRSAYAPDWQPAATVSENKRFTAQGPGRARRYFWTAMSIPARHWARRPMSSIARKTPAAADRLIQPLDFWLREVPLSGVFWRVCQTNKPEHLKPRTRICSTRS